MKYTWDTELITKCGQQIRTLRKAKGISQQELANLANIELSQINRIELGKINTSLSQIASIAKALNIPPKAIFEFE
jgi:transcriptional regulator with XRE-family HTH domain